MIKKKVKKQKQPTLEERIEILEFNALIVGKLINAIVERLPKKQAKKKGTK